MVNYREEAIVLVKAIIEEWTDNKDFDRAVTILEDYIIDQNTAYRGKLEKMLYDLETARVT